MPELPNDHPANTEMWMKWTHALRPGSEHARAHGCLCDPDRNALAETLSADDSKNTIVVIHQDCPMHGKRIPFPEDPEYSGQDSDADG